MAGARSRWTVVGAAAAALTLGTSSPAMAATVSPPVVSGLVGPLGLEVNADGTAYVAETFRDAVVEVRRDGTTTEVLHAAGVSGLTTDLDGGLVYTYSVDAGGERPRGQLQRRSPGGTTTVLGYLGRYERGENPDHMYSYGFQGLTQACRDKVPAQIGGQAYRGLVDTHPYAVERLAGGRYAVADAGSNAIMEVGPDQRVTALAVLPPVPVQITAQAAQGLGLPACVVGHDYAFESVPTDVQKGPDGLLYVSALTGGPEDGSLGPLSRVYTVDPRTGAVKKIGDGFAGATGIAVAPDGRVYVAELYAGRVSTVRKGFPVPVAQVAQPGAIEFHGRKLWVTKDVLPPEGGMPDGKLVRITV